MWGWSLSSRREPAPFSEGGTSEKEAAVSRRKATARANLIRMSGEAMENLPINDWIDVVVVSFEGRKGEMSIPNMRNMASLIDRTADKEERARDGRAATLQYVCLYCGQMGASHPGKVPGEYYHRDCYPLARGEAELAPEVARNVIGRSL